MKKVFQSNICKDDGDCCRAVIASLFEKELNEVPDFVPDGNQGYELMKYFESQGYSYTYFNRLENAEGPTIEEVAKYDGGIDGYFYASVNSQTFEDTSHAVVVDTNLNIVHDPNPNGLSLTLKPKDVLGIIVVGSWFIGLDGKFYDL